MMISVAPRHEAEQQDTTSTRYRQSELLIASEQHLSGQMPAADFDELASRYVSDYRAAIYALAKAQYRSGLTRLLYAFMDWLAQCMRSLVARLTRS